ncbi:hypothetical protein BH18ACT13_BH18ACT13_09370 [soil metagenome]
MASPPETARSSARRRLCKRRNHRLIRVPSLRRETIPLLGRIGDELLVEFALTFEAAGQRTFALLRRRHHSPHRRGGRRQAVRENGALDTSRRSARKSGASARRAPDPARYPRALSWNAWRASRRSHRGVTASRTQRYGRPAPSTDGARATAHVCEPLDRRGREPVRALPANGAVTGDARQHLRTRKVESGPASTSFTTSRSDSESDPERASH